MFFFKKLYKKINLSKKKMRKSNKIPSCLAYSIVCLCRKCQGLFSFLLLDDGLLCGSSEGAEIWVYFDGSGLADLVSDGLSEISLGS